VELRLREVILHCRWAQERYARFFVAPDENVRRADADVTETSWPLFCCHYSGDRLSILRRSLRRRIGASTYRYASPASDDQIGRDGPECSGNSASNCERKPYGRTFAAAHIQARFEVFPITDSSRTSKAVRAPPQHRSAQCICKLLRATACGYFCLRPTLRSLIIPPVNSAERPGEMTQRTPTVTLSRERSTRFATLPSSAPPASAETG
jgi:hypothetical protein